MGTVLQACKKEKDEHLRHIEAGAEAVEVGRTLQPKFPFSVSAPPKSG